MVQVKSVVLSLREQLKGSLDVKCILITFLILTIEVDEQNIKACSTVRTDRKNVPKSLPLDKLYAER